MNSQHIKLSSLYLLVPAITLLLGSLYLLSHVNYLLYHTLIEMASIVIAFIIFIIGWNTRKYSRNNMFIVLATGYLVVGAIDLLHTLAYSGMGVFTQFDSNAPTQFWIAARYVAGFAYLAAAIYLGSKKVVRPQVWLYGFLSAGIILTYSVFIGIFPDSFIEGEGLTTFKIVSEYVISTLFVISGVIIWRKRNHLTKNTMMVLLLAGAFTILSEMSFTLYVDVYGFFNFLGHIFKLISIAFIYRILVFESLTNPFKFLFREVAVANERIAQNEKKFRELVEQSTDWVWEVDNDGRLTYSNPQAVKLVGYEIDEILGMTIFDLMDPGEVGEKSDYFRKMAEEHKPFNQFETTIVHKDGTSRIFETNGVPIINKQEQLMGYQGMSRDITERKKTELEIKEAKEKAENANRAKTNFLANMSHEIRTPMNVLMGTSELLFNSDLSPVQKEWMEMVRNSADSLFYIINNLLDYSTVEAGKLTLEQTSFNLRKAVEQTFSVFESQAREKGLKPSLIIDDAIPDTVIGDLFRFRQVIANLIDNAVKFTENGEILVEAKPAEPGQTVTVDTNGDALNHRRFPVIFSIHDEGIGIRPEQVDNLFQVFSKVDTPGAIIHEGIGLGLAFAKNLVELMGGSIWVKSRKNGGSTFYFEIPFILPPQEEETKNYHFSQTREAKNSSYRVEDRLEILLVEDKPMNQKLATVLLEKQGHHVCIAGNGFEALRMFGSQNIDLILMDIHLPELDGLETTQRIRALEKDKGGHVPIIAMTAYAMQKDKDRCLQAGMDYYISKPIDTGDLYNVLDRVIKGIKAKPTENVQRPEDLEELLHRFDGNTDLLHELLVMFFQDFNRDLRQIKGLLKVQDALPTLVTVVHGIKGEIVNLGMSSAYKTTCELEVLVKENRLEEAASVLNLLESKIKMLEFFFTDEKWQDKI